MRLRWLWASIALLEVIPLQPAGAHAEADTFRIAQAPSARVRLAKQTFTQMVATRREPDRVVSDYATFAELTCTADASGHIQMLQNEAVQRLNHTLKGALSR